MTNHTELTIVGNITDDPELRFTPGGVAVASVSVASTQRILDNNTNEWRDGEPVFMRLNIWRDMGENMAESLIRGARVIATGRLRQSNWEDKDGNKRSRIEMDVDDIGASMKFATCKVIKVTRETAEPDATEPETEKPATTTRARSGGRSTTRTRART